MSASRNGSKEVRSINKRLITMTSLQNPGFDLEILLLMKDELALVEERIHAIETSRIVDRNEYYKLKQAEECYGEYFKK
jgi:hypothetical protein